MYFIYIFFLIVLAILFLPLILIAFTVQPKLRAGFWQKIGFYKTKFPEDKKIWIHAVSVGEVNAVESLIKATKTAFPDYKLLLSTVTKTGNQVANNKLGEIVDEIIYFPYDFIFSVRSALNVINPNLVIIAETEIWPTFSTEVNRKNIPLIVVNGRISPNSHKGYKKISFFLKTILSKYTQLLMQTQGDAQRIIDIGAPEEKTEVMGNLKFDIASTKLSLQEIETLKESIGLNTNRLIIAGSTHSGEDEIILEVFKKLKEHFTDIKLLLAPRHPERNENVFKLIEKTGLNAGKRSLNDSFAEKDIIILDTMGELGKLYSIAHLAFIGGSFSNTGGHNPLEAAIYNVPTLSGPTVFNFKDIYKFLTATKASIVVNNEDELFSAFSEILSDEQKYSQISNACEKVFTDNAGAIDFCIKRIKQLLS